jgi:hypothetical protein
MQARAIPVFAVGLYKLNPVDPLLESRIVADP